MNSINLKMKGEKCKGVIFEMLGEWKLSSKIHNRRRDDRSGLYLVYAFRKVGVRLNKHQEGEMTIKELQKKLAASMRRWQKIENSAIVSTGYVMEKTENPIIRLIMEIIQRDSQMHYLVQQWIADSVESKTVSLTPDELKKVWGLIERHTEIEEAMVEIVKEALDSLKGKKMYIQEYLLKYLQEDEIKHTSLLKSLEELKKGMIP